MSGFSGGIIVMQIQMNQYHIASVNQLAQKTTILVDSYFECRVPRFQKYLGWDFLRKEVCGVIFSVEMGPCLNSHCSVVYRLLG